MTPDSEYGERDRVPQYPSWEQIQEIHHGQPQLVRHGHADQVVDLTKENIRDIVQLPAVPAPKGSERSRYHRHTVSSKAYPSL